MDDRETRERLLKVAAQLFSERGFSKVTVRDICQQARANVAAINYHFGGKAGLYEELLKSAITAMQGTTEAVRQAGEHCPPDKQLEAYITIFLQRVHAVRENWIHQLMMRELSDPTPFLDLVVEQVFKPRLSYLSSIIAALLGCEQSDARVGRCLLSINSQFLALLDNPVSERLRQGRPMTADDITDLARHMTCFSLAGIRAIAST
jgi:TetR/AcrR family transcriptional regulator, regulator of cefoperazone and chloramphenicol sensitivity